jgi:endonuclease YncB( thermonuclease family)
MGLCKSKSSHNLPTNNFQNFKNFSTIFNNDWKIAYVHNVYDGDTFTCSMFFSKEWMNFRVRCVGYDSPELKPLKSIPDRDLVIRNAMIARDALAKQVLNQWVLINTQGFDKYGRILGIVYNDIPSSYFRVEIDSNFSANNVFISYIQSCRKVSVNKFMLDNNFGNPLSFGPKILN